MPSKKKTTVPGQVRTRLDEPTVLYLAHSCLTLMCRNEDMAEEAETEKSKCQETIQACEERVRLIDSELESGLDENDRIVSSIRSILVEKTGLDLEGLVGKVSTKDYRDSGGSLSIVCPELFASSETADESADKAAMQERPAGDESSDTAPDEEPADYSGPADSYSYEDDDVNPSSPDPENGVPLFTYERELDTRDSLYDSPFKKYF